MAVEIVTFILLVVVGLMLSLGRKAEGKPGDRTNRWTMIMGLAILGIGAFGLLDFPLSVEIAALVTSVGMIVIPLGVTKSVTGMAYGVAAVLIILLLSLLLSFAAGGSWLVEAVAAITESSVQFSNPVTDWIGNL